MNIKFDGNTLTLVGKQLAVGDKFPQFSLVKKDLKVLSLADTSGVRVFLTVPSLDTEVCDIEVKRFNKEAVSHPGVSVYVVSVDLPFAQARWCGAAGIENVISVSDYAERSFGNCTGTYIKELALLTRAVFVVGSDGVVTYVEYLDEITNEPNYAASLNAAKQAK